jgi:kinesin family protein 11
VHAETVRVVEEQIQDLDVQMQDLDEFVARAKSHNAGHHERHAESVQKLSTTVKRSFANISDHFKETFGRVQALGAEMDADADALRDALAPLDEKVCQPLAELREDVQNTQLREYVPTGQTPEKVHYQYPTELPRTAAHADLLASMQDSEPDHDPAPAPALSPTPCRPAGPVVLPDIDMTPVRSPSRPASTDSQHHQQQQSGGDGSVGSGSSKSRLSMSLREVNPNLTAGSLVFDAAAAAAAAAAGAGTARGSLPGGGPLPSSAAAAAATGETTVPLAKNTRTRGASRLSKKVVGAIADGPENVPPPLRSSTRRKSPRLH